MEHCPAASDSCKKLTEPSPLRVESADQLAPADTVLLVGGDACNFCISIPYVLLTASKYREAFRPAV